MNKEFKKWCERRKIEESLPRPIRKPWGANRKLYNGTSPAPVYQYIEKPSRHKAKDQYAIRINIIHRKNKKHGRSRYFRAYTYGSYLMAGSSMEELLGKVRAYMGYFCIIKLKMVAYKVPARPLMVTDATEAIGKAVRITAARRADIKPVKTKWKIAKHEVLYIRQAVKYGNTQAELGRIYGVARTTIGQIVRGESRTNL